MKENNMNEIKAKLEKGIDPACMLNVIRSLRAELRAEGRPVPMIKKLSPYTIDWMSRYGEAGALAMKEIKDPSCIAPFTPEQMLYI